MVPNPVMPQSTAFILVLGDKKLPIDIHQPAADAQGVVVDVGKRSLAFGFTWAGIDFTAIYGEDQQGVLIALSARLNSSLLPADIQAVVAAANDRLGPLLRLTAGGVELVGTTRVPTPVTAVSLIGALASFLLPAKPYLELLGGA